MDFINKVILALKLIRSVKNDILIKEGDLVEEALFVKSGVLCLEFSINFSRMILNDYEEDFSNNGSINVLENNKSIRSSLIQRYEIRKIKRKQRKKLAAALADEDEEIIKGEMRNIKLKILEEMNIFEAC